nr:hypothetical protein BaRGS_009588 [Batillaria attramentaria]
MNQEMSDLDPLMSDLADRLLEPALSNVNLMLFSDHGMTTIDDTKTINVSAALSPDDYIIVLEYCSLASIYTVPGKEDEVYNKLVNYHPHLTVYRKSGLPNKWHYKHGKYVAPITVVADQGWFILTPYLNTYPVRPEDGQPMLGWHGYDNKKRDMHGIFIGMGPVMCDILDIQASPNNGSLAKMKPLLKRHRCDDDDDDDDASDRR